MTKPHAVCAGCPRENSTSTHQHQYVGSPVPSDADLVIIAEAPVCDRYGNVPRAFQDDGGKIIRTAVDNLRRLPEYKNLNVAYTYAVLCTSNQGDTDPPKNGSDTLSNDAPVGPPPHQEAAGVAGHGDDGSPSP
jgi:uracil-DNA glycosylase